MAQPSHRLDDVEPAGEVMAQHGEFWVKNPWRYPSDLNLSAFEPNRVYLNRGGLDFLDATYLSGAGSVGDGRGVLVADINGDLQPDLIARNIGGGSVVVYLNRFPRRGRLTVTLKGTRSNRLGIGARVVAAAGASHMVRELFPINNHLVQQASRVRFGLGDANRVDRLTVHWPSGEVTELHDLPADQHILVTEGKTGYTVR